MENILMIGRMKMTSKTKNENLLFFLLSALPLLLAACSTAVQTEPPIRQEEITDEESQTPQFIQHELDPTYAAQIAAQRDPNVPDLPFPDNPDPSQCGIPSQWGLEDPAWLTGIYEGELIQPTVFLYDSHLRMAISGEAPHGSEVTILLYQQNPVTDYYMVKVKDADEAIQGWIPAPLLSFEPVEPL